MSRGSIHRQPNGTWRARYRNPEGRDRSRNFDRKIDADRFLVSVEHSKQTGSYIDPSAGKVTFKSYAENWRGKQIHRRGTEAQIETNLRRHVYPRIGHRAIASIRQSEVQGLVKVMIEGDGTGHPLAPSTVKTILTWVSSIFTSAVADRVIAVSPCAGVRLPPVERKSVVPWEVERVEAVRDGVPDRYKALVVFGAGTGVRISEALGLTVDRVDFLSPDSEDRPPTFPDRRWRTGTWPRQGSTEPTSGDPASRRGAHGSERAPDEVARYVWRPDLHQPPQRASPAHDVLGHLAEGGRTARGSGG